MLSRENERMGGQRYAAEKKREWNLVGQSIFGRRWENDVMSICTHDADAACDWRVYLARAIRAVYLLYSLEADIRAVYLLYMSVHPEASP